MARSKKNVSAAVEIQAPTVDVVAPDVDFTDLEDSEVLQGLVDKFEADGGKIEQVPEGVTGAVKALVEALKEVNLVKSFDENSERLFQEALDSAAQYKDEVLVEFASLGHTNFINGIMALMEEGLFVEAYRPIKYVMRRLTSETYYRFYNAAREQQRALVRTRGGIDAPDIHVTELYTRGLDYPGADNTLSPAEQLHIIEQIHDQLNFVYIELQKFQKEFTNWEDMEIKPLPFFWYVDEENAYHEILDIHAAFLELDNQAQQRKARRIAERRAGLKALKAMRVA